MYKFKKEYIGQEVTAFLADGSRIFLETATQKELEKAYKAGNKQFISKNKGGNSDKKTQIFDKNK